MRFKYYEYHQLVERLSEKARENPRRHRRNTWLLALAAYLVVGIFWLLALALILATVLIILHLLDQPDNVEAGIFIFALAPALIGLLLASKLIYRAPPPEGVRLHPKEFPDLYEVIRDTRMEIRCPKINHVYLSFDLNAAAYRRPFLGIAGPGTNILMIGLPMFHLFSSAQLRAVIAHELAHFAKEHTNPFYYRIHSIWERIYADVMGHQGLLRWVLRPLVNPFFLALMAHIAIRAREQELEADRLAARVVGPQVAGAALELSNVAGSYLSEKLQPFLFEKMKAAKSPEGFPFYQEFGRMIYEGIGGSSMEVHLQKAMLINAASFDMHPSLPDRLENIGYDREATTAAQTGFAVTNASRTFLSKHLGSLTGSYNKFYEKALAAEWAMVNAEAENIRKEHTTLYRKFKDIGLQDLFQLWRLANQAEYLDGLPKALRFYNELHERAPANVATRFALARSAMEEARQAGASLPAAMLEEELRAIANHSERYRFDSLSMLHELFLLSGKKAEADAVYLDLLKLADRITDAKDERNRLRVADRYKHHGFDEETLASLQKALAEYTQLKTAYLVERKGSADGLEPFYVLAINLKPFVGAPFEAINAYVSAIADTCAFFGDVNIANYASLNVIIRFKIRWTKRSQIFNKKIRKKIAC